MPTHIYKNPEKYSKNNSLQFDFAMQVIKNSEIDSHARVLDIGCGDGRITFELAKLVDSVVGTDISNNMIEHAKNTYQHQKNLRFIQMDGSKNIFKKQFTVVTSFNCLHWIKDQESALKGIAAAATENAKIILLLSHRKSTYHFALDAIMESSKWSDYFVNYTNPRSFFGVEEYDALLKNAGLNVLSLVEREMTHYFNSIDQLKNFFSASMANIKQIPDNQKDEFLNDYCDIFLKLLDCKDFSQMPVSFWCLDVLATKPELCKELDGSKSLLDQDRFRPKL